METQLREKNEKLQKKGTEALHRQGYMVRQNVNKHGDKTNYMQEIPNLLTKSSR